MTAGLSPIFTLTPKIVPLAQVRDKLASQIQASTIPSSPERNTLCRPETDRNPAQCLPRPKPDQKHLRTKPCAIQSRTDKFTTQTVQYPSHPCDREKRARPGGKDPIRRTKLVSNAARFQVGFPCNQSVAIRQRKPLQFLWGQRQKEFFSPVLPCRASCSSRCCRMIAPAFCQPQDQCRRRGPVPAEASQSRQFALLCRSLLAAGTLPRLSRKAQHDGKHAALARSFPRCGEAAPVQAFNMSAAPCKPSKTPSAN